MCESLLAWLRLPTGKFLLVPDTCQRWRRSRGQVSSRTGPGLLRVAATDLARWRLDRAPGVRQDDGNPGGRDVRNLIYLVACTVDGFIARQDGSFDCFPVEGDHIAGLIESFPEMIPGHLRGPL